MSGSSRRGHLNLLVTPLAAHHLAAHLVARPRFQIPFPAVAGQDDLAVRTGALAVSRAMDLGSCMHGLDSRPIACSARAPPSCRLTRRARAWPSCRLRHIVIIVIIAILAILAIRRSWRPEWRPRSPLAEAPGRLRFGGLWEAQLAAILAHSIPVLCGNLCSHRSFGCID